MNFKKILPIALCALAIISVALVASVYAMPFGQGFSGKIRNMMNPSMHEFGNANITQAIAANDYNAFLTAVQADNLSSSRTFQNMTQEKFDKMVAGYNQTQNRGMKMQQMNTAVANNDYTTYENITHERFNKMVATHNQTQNMQVRKQQIDTAITNNDYAAWKQAMTVNGKLPKFAENITQDNFSTYIKLMQAIQSKDFATAKNLSAELGFQTPQNHMGFGAKAQMARGTMQRSAKKFGIGRA